MTRNIGTTDRAIRVAAGAVIAIAGFATGSWWGILGAIPLATAFVGYCGLYSLLGVNTCKVKTN